LAKTAMADVLDMEDNISSLIDFAALLRNLTSRSGSIEPEVVSGLYRIAVQMTGEIESLNERHDRIARVIRQIVA
jgi:hypothetical protein